ncbi:MAG: hypothetical protein JKX70_02070 [Phycisphaerales bacterium]|nr:hypothetical protein [Phycisphaerales bacterium]
MYHSKQSLIIVGCAIGMLAGCDRTEIQSYRVAREFDGSAAASQAEAQAAIAQRVSPEVTWTLPSEWHEVETTSSMRLATFQTSHGQEIALTAFPGDVGGLIANVNRWRGQIGLDPADEQGIASDIVELDGVNVTVVDVSNEGRRLVGTIINVGDGKTWFVKATGSIDSVEEAKAQMIAFSKTFMFDEHNHDHDHDHEAESSPSAPEASSSPWEQPSQWTVEENASSMLISAFLSESGARITLTSLMGTGGGSLANINRWRGQLGLTGVPTLEEAGIVDMGNGAMFVDMESADASARMAAGIVPVGEGTMFFKLTGPSESVEVEIERFRAYINAQGLGKAGAP